MTTAPINKVELQSKIQINEESALKCLEFATQFMLKKAEYRLLNPLLFDHLTKEQMTEQTQLMAELSTYSAKEKNQKKIKKNSKSLSSSIKKSSVKKIQSPKKQQSSPTSNKPKSNDTSPRDISKLLEIGSDELNSHILPEKKVTVAPNVSKPPIKATTSYLVGESWILNQQSNIQTKNKENKKKLDFSSDQDDQKSTNSKRNQPKTQNLKPFTKKPDQKRDQPMVNLQMNFKKKAFTQSPIDKKTPSAKDSEDELDIYPIAKSSNKKDGINEGLSLNTSDFKSYESSIVSDAKKIKIDVVSEHASENDISVVSQTKGYKYNPKNELDSRTKLKKKSNSYNEDSPGKNENDESKSQRSEILQPKNPYVLKKGNQFDNEFENAESEFGEIPQGSNIQAWEKTPEPDEPSPEQVTSYLMKMESFDVKQEMLMKKLGKIWGRESKSIKAVKSITWADLNLPKPSFRIITHQYAQVIQ